MSEHDWDNPRCGLDHEHDSSCFRVPPNPADTNGDVTEIEIPATPAPTFPHETTLNNSYAFFQRTIGGGMLLKFVPLVALPDGRNMPDPHAVCIVFSPDGWERFKRTVEADGEQSRIVTARHFPEGLVGGVG